MITTEEVYRLLSRVESTLDNISSRMERIETMAMKLPCDVHTTEIKTLKKIVYGACAVVLLAFLNGVLQPETAFKAKDAQAMVSGKGVIIEVPEPVNSKDIPSG